MPYYLSLRSPDGGVQGDEPYKDIAAAREDAEVGAKQIVGDALKGGAPLQAAVRNRAFEILDEDGRVIAVLSFWSLINSASEPIPAQTGLDVTGV